MYVDICVDGNGGWIVGVYRYAIYSRRDLNDFDYGSMILDSDLRQSLSVFQSMNDGVVTMKFLHPFRVVISLTMLDILLETLLS